MSEAVLMPINPVITERTAMTQEEFAAKAIKLRDKLYRMACLYLGGNEAFALEVVDEAIYKGLISLKRLRQPEHFNTWLTRIVINGCMDTLRRKKRELTYETIPEEAVESYDALPLKEAVRALPQELKEVVILRYFSDHTLAETAQLLDIPQGTVVTRQRRALRILKLELED